MFSTSTQPAPMRAEPSTSSTRVGGLDKDVRMNDAGGTAGGRKGSSRIKTHRLRTTGVDLYKPDRGPAKTSLAARANVVDPEHKGVSIRGASTITGRAKRATLATVIRESAENPINANTMDVWREFVQRRYDPQSKFLNLENMASDETLKNSGQILPGQPGATYRLGGVIFKIAAKLSPEVESISIANNNLRNLSVFSTLNSYLPNLANLSLQNNQLDELHELDKIAGRGTKVSLLRELILTGNPIREKEFRKGNLQHYTSEVRRRFPMLEMLDMEPLLKIEFDLSSDVSRHGKSKQTVQNYPLTFPLPMGPHGMAPDNQALVGTFLSRYFELYDENRPGLTLAYAPNALFSYSANTSIPIRARIEGHHTSKEMPNQTKLEWKSWLEKSRNLSRVGRNIERAAKTLYTNADNIVECIKGLPKTKHDISVQENFSLDAWPVMGALPDGGACMLVAVHGQFVEEPSGGVRSFDRAMMLAPAPDGSPSKNAGWDAVILSDQLTVRAYSSPRAWVQGPLKVTSDSNQLEALSLTEPQKQLVLQLSARTNLSYTYAAQCLAENAWDTERAVANFEQIKGQLGAEAFNKS